jgi:hypothetical protein
MRTWIASASLLVLATFVAVPASAQEGISFGVKAGANIASTNVEAVGFDISPDSRTGLVAGVFVFYPFREQIGLQVEGLFSQKGAKVNDLGIDVDLRLDYFEIPVLGRFGVRASDDATVHVVAGPAFAFKVNDSLDVSDFFGFDEIDIKPYDVGLSVGGGVTFRNIVVDARYTHGLVNINDEAALDDFLEVKNRVFSITVGWQFR